MRAAAEPDKDFADGSALDRACANAARLCFLKPLPTLSRNPQAKAPFRMLLGVPDHEHEAAMIEAAERERLRVCRR
jgi:hypothetical protein